MKKRDSEVDAYAFIKEHLKIQGWIVKNPNRVADGQVYTQTECLDNPFIKEQLGKLHPENIIKLSERELYLIESKRRIEQIGQAVSEAKEYAEMINKSRHIKCVIISGVAGNETDGFVIKSFYLEDGEFEPIKINEKESTGLISPTIATYILENKRADISDMPVDEKLFLKTAEKINKILHMGAINKNTRAKVMACLLLSMVDETKPNLSSAPSVLIKDINSRAENVLLRNKKREFFDCIRISLPASQDNHIKFKTAVVNTMQELENLNIRSAMNSGTDVLGKFYEVFLKYGNGAKEIGIVLTPRHITRFAAEVLGVNAHDIVYDPTCGTGGFLVAALDEAKKTADKDEMDFFKGNGIYGIEQEPEVAALAIVNMIFRGDGKNNIEEGNCFQKSLILKKTSGGLSAKFVNDSEVPEVKSPAATRILMNPPFALKTSDEQEYKFINRALEQCQDGAFLFSVLPSSTLTKSGGEYRWRNNLLKNNRLVSVMTFPSDLFYPVGVETAGIIIQKGVQHKPNQKVAWFSISSDGFYKKKGKRLPNQKVRNQLEEIKDGLRKFILEDDPFKLKNIPRFIKLAPVNHNDEEFSFYPEAYIDDIEYKTEDFEREIKYLVRSALSFGIKYADILKKSKISDVRRNNIYGKKLGDLFEISYGQKEYHSKENLEEGKTIVISSSSRDNGCYGFFDVKPYFKALFITVASTGSVGESAVQEYDCCVDDAALVLMPKEPMNIDELYYCAAFLRLIRWRFSYSGRNMTPDRIRDLAVPSIKTNLTKDKIIKEFISKVTD